MARETISIERLLIWTYQQQRADLYGEISMAPGRSGHSADGVYEVARRAGGHLPAPAVPGSAIDDDAIAVHTLATACRSDGYRRPGADLLIQYGRIGGRPDWRPGARHRLVPRNRRGDGQPVTDAWFDKVMQTRVVWTPIMAIDDPASVDLARRTYDLWHEAVTRVRAALVNRGGTLRRWQLDRTLPPAKPWRPEKAVDISDVA